MQMGISLIAAHLAFVSNCVVLKDIQPTPENSLLVLNYDKDEDVARPKDLSFTLVDEEINLEASKREITPTDENARPDPSSHSMRSIQGSGEDLYGRGEDPECRAYDWKIMKRDLPPQDRVSDMGFEVFMEQIWNNNFAPTPTDAFTPKETKLVKKNTRAAFEKSIEFANKQGKRQMTKGRLPTVKLLGAVAGHCHRGRAFVVTPPDHNESVPMPLVLHLHGFMMNPRSYLEVFNYPIAMEIEKLQSGQDYSAYHVIPWGKAFFNTELFRFWRTGIGHCCDYPPPMAPFNVTCNQDDIGYMKLLLKTAVTTLNVIKEQVYVIGFSNGGYLTENLACHFAEGIAAVAVQAGVATGFCVPERPVPHLQLHGINDEVVRYPGGRLGGRFAVPHVGAEATALAWAQLNNCTEMSETTRNLFPEDVGGAIGIENETEVKIYHNCAYGTTVELWSVPGMGHTNISAFTTFDAVRSRKPLQEIMKWLWQHKREPDRDAFFVSPDSYNEHWSNEECGKAPHDYEDGDSPTEKRKRLKVLLKSAKLEEKRMKSFLKHKKRT